MRTNKGMKDRQPDKDNVPRCTVSKLKAKC
jgi:hypothetical protein